MANDNLSTRVATLEAEMAVVKERLEYAQNLAKIERGIGQMHRGEGVPAREVFARLRKKYKIAAK